ncbi:MAG: hypothetical protein AAF698_01180, partial [Pseudomonadota bacterium]
SDETYRARIPELTQRQSPALAVPETARPAPSTSDESRPEGRERRRGRGKAASSDDALAVVGEAPDAAEPVSTPESGSDDRRRGRRSERGGRGRSGGGERRGGGDGKPVVGLGDHCPAFLLRPVPEHMLKKSRTAAKAEDAEDEGVESAAA